jgi:hypothetical protein
LSESGRILRNAIYMQKVTEIDTVVDIARKIYNNFNVLEVCEVYGWFDDVDRQTILEKGEMVLAEIRRLDEDEHVKWTKTGKRLRENRYKAGTIGGPIAHKIFTWDRTIVNNEPRHRIWRIQ